MIEIVEPWIREDEDEEDQKQDQERPDWRDIEEVHDEWKI